MKILAISDLSYRLIKIVVSLNISIFFQVVDPQVFSIFTLSSDFTHLYFSYRWFLLDFKRGLALPISFLETLLRIII